MEHERRRSLPRRDKYAEIGREWKRVQIEMAVKSRKVRGGSSLPHSLGKQRGRDRKPRPPRLTRTRILQWADAHHARTGEWPGTLSGAIAAAPGETWLNIDNALKNCLRGLKPRTDARGAIQRDSLCKLIGRFRSDARPHRVHDILTERDILSWADEHHDRTGQWPSKSSGQVRASMDNTWYGIDSALKRGARGLSGKSSLALLIGEKRGRRHIRALPPLSEGKILAWADAHHKRTGRWPNRDSGPIPGASGDTWSTLYNAMIAGRRGLPVQSLAALLKKRRRVGERGVPLLSIPTIRRWAEDHHAKHGRWPTSRTGQVDAAPDTTWMAINAAMITGCRGLPGGTSLSRALSGRKKAALRERAKPPLTHDQVLLWAKAHARRYGAWPEKYSGRVEDAPGETWLGIDEALAGGLRGLPACGSLTAFLAGRKLPGRFPVRIRRPGAVGRN